MTYGVLRYTNDEPIYDRRIVVAALNPLVHYVLPMMQYEPIGGLGGLPPGTTVLPFTGKYCTCCGILDNNVFEKTPGEWKTWLLPVNTPLTCLQCIRLEEIERGRRRTSRP